MFFRTSIKQQPRYEPDETDRARGDECGAPTPRDRDHRHDERRYERADVRAGVKDSSRERAFFLREPFSNSLDRRRKVSRLTETEQETRRTEAKHSVSQRMGHRRYTPEDDRE